MLSMLKIRRRGPMTNQEGRSVFLQTWALVPVTGDCPYVFGYFSPERKVLTLQSRYKKENLDITYKKDNKGRYVTTKHGTLQKLNTEREEQWYEIAIDNEEDIRAFLNAIAINANDDFPVSVEYTDQPTASEVDGLPAGKFVNEEGKTAEEVLEGIDIEKES